MIVICVGATVVHLVGMRDPGGARDMDSLFPGLACMDTVVVLPVRFHSAVYKEIGIALADSEYSIRLVCC